MVSSERARKAVPDHRRHTAVARGEHPPSLRLVADTYTESGDRAYGPATLSRRVAAIGHHHRRGEHPAPGGNEIVADSGRGKLQQAP
ncbi:hypothetical protein [Rhodococcus tibetensis]|uniref:hypothetical protein n=1 Tax=Rhodococcus tibetensis TaxID=2965064 RepID=UPI0027E347BD|nr:hypothetical protein [Rhodococcus sp. FXJ9.536]